MFFIYPNYLSTYVWITIYRLCMYLSKFLFVKCVCLFDYLSIFLTNYLFVCLSDYLSICLTFYLSVSLSNYLSFCVSDCLIIYLSFLSFIYLSFYLSLCLLSIFLSVSLSNYLSVYSSYPRPFFNVFNLENHRKMSLECRQTNFFDCSQVLLHNQP